MILMQKMIERRGKGTSENKTKANHLTNTHNDETNHNSFISLDVVERSSRRRCNENNKLTIEQICSAEFIEQVANL